MRLKYICYFDWPDSRRKRNAVSSATNKLDYMFEAFNKAGYGIDIISPSSALEPEPGWAPGVVEKRGQNTLRLFGTVKGGRSRLWRYVGRQLCMLQLWAYLLFTLRKSDKVVVYHSLMLDSMMIWLKKLKGFELIGEIEEVYQDVRQESKRHCREEYKFFDICDKHIFCARSLEAKVNGGRKPYAMIHGTYRAEPQIDSPADDGLTHVVYSGTFDPEKGGALVAIAAAPLLPPGYRLHVLGFGNPAWTRAVKEAIAKANAQGADVVFEGDLPYGEYKRMLQRSHVGCAAQRVDVALNATSFPSKILTYMANGLTVVSVRVPAIEDSDVGAHLVYSLSEAPEHVAQAIVRAATDERRDTRDVLRQLSASFTEAIPRLIEC